MPNTNTKLVDSKTIAALFDMTPRRVQQLTKEGVIAAVKEGNANRYDLLPTIQKYIRYLTAKANGREPSKKDAETEGRRLEAEADLKRSKADIAALQLKELEGTMHRSEATMTDLVWHQVNARGSARASGRGCHQCGHRCGDVLRARTAPAGGRMSDSTRCFRDPCQTVGEQEKAPGISGGPPRLYRRGCA